MSKAMRDAFFDRLYDLAKKDRDIILLSGDFGAPSLDKFKRNLSEQYINMGVAEQNMVSVAAGLAMGGKKVYVYAIAPFATLRCFEQIKIDLCCMKLPVTIVGVGAGFSYHSAGPTHHATEDIAIMRVLPGMTIWCPSDNRMVEWLASTKIWGPTYIRLDRESPQSIYNEDKFLGGMSRLVEGNDLCIVSTGTMVHKALEVAKNLPISASVIDLYRVKPIEKNLLMHYLRGYERIVTIEEHFINGGIGSIIAEFLVDNEMFHCLKRIAIPDEYCFKHGTREDLYKAYGLDTGNIVKNITEWVKCQI